MATKKGGKEKEKEVSVSPSFGQVLEADLSMQEPGGAPHALALPKRISEEVYLANLFFHSAARECHCSLHLSADENTHR